MPQALSTFVVALAFSAASFVIGWQSATTRFQGVVPLPVPIPCDVGGAPPTHPFMPM